MKTTTAGAMVCAIMVVLYAVLATGGCVEHGHDDHVVVEHRDDVHHDAPHDDHHDDDDHR